MILNKKWHLSHPFPHGKSEGEKDKWRAEHSKICGCGRRGTP